MTLIKRQVSVNMVNLFAFLHVHHFLDFWPLALPWTCQCLTGSHHLTLLSQIYIMFGCMYLKTSITLNSVKFLFAVIIFKDHAYILWWWSTNCWSLSVYPSVIKAEFELRSPEHQWAGNVGEDLVELGMHRPLFLDPHSATHPPGPRVQLGSRRCRETIDKISPVCAPTSTRRQGIVND